MSSAANRTISFKRKARSIFNPYPAIFFVLEMLSAFKELFMEIRRS